MKLFRHLIITIVCIVTSIIANAGEQLTPRAKAATDQPTTETLQLLQGTWEGVDDGDPSHQKITIKITGNSFHFHRDTNFWFETTITLPAGADPKQLHATIRDCPPSQADSIGKVVGAIFKIDDETLTLAAYDTSNEPPKTFDSATSRHVVEKVQPQKKNSQVRVNQTNLPAPTPAEFSRHRRQVGNLSHVSDDTGSAGRKCFTHASRQH